MGKIKSYQLFLEDKKVEPSESVKEIITQFLISQERKSGLFFSNFDLIDDDNGREKFIIAYTQEGPNGEIPPVDKVVFDILDYYTWHVKYSYEKGDYEFDDTWKKPKVKNLETALKDMKTSLLRSIVLPDPSKKQFEPNEDDKKLIDKIFEINNVWNKCKSQVKYIMKTISKYSIEEIEDRLVEFTDELTGWEPRIMFAWNYKMSWHGLQADYDINDQTCRFISDAWYEMNKPYENSKFEEFLSMCRPCIYIELNRSENRIYKKLSEVEPIGFKIGKRFQQLYNVEKVEYPYYPNTRRFEDSTDIGDYLLTIILK